MLAASYVCMYVCVYVYMCVLCVFILDTVDSPLIAGSDGQLEKCM